MLEVIEEDILSLTRLVCYHFPLPSSPIRSSQQVSDGGEKKTQRQVYLHISTKWQAHVDISHRHVLLAAWVSAAEGAFTSAAIRHGRP